MGAGYFASWIPAELLYSYINAESNQLLNGTGSSGALPGLTGFFQTSSTLTRSLATGEYLTDTLLIGISDLRVATNSYAEANLIVLHPNLWTLIRTTRDGYGRYLLDSANESVADADAQSLWGVRVALSTLAPQTQALILDTRKAAIFFIREGVKISSAAMNGATQNGKTT